MLIQNSDKMHVYWTSELYSRCCLQHAQSSLPPTTTKTSEKRERDSNFLSNTDAQSESFRVCFRIENRLCCVILLLITLFALWSPNRYIIGALLEFSHFFFHIALAWNFIRLKNNYAKRFLFSIFNLIKYRLAVVGGAFFRNCVYFCASLVYFFNETFFCVFVSQSGTRATTIYG